MKNEGERPGILGPMILIVTGVVLLLNQLGRLPGDFWWNVWRYWPVILILAGIEVLLGISRSRWMYLLGVVLALSVVGGLVAYAVLRGGSATERPATGTETISHALQDAESARIRLRMAAGTIEVGPVSDSPNLVEARLEHSRRSSPVEDKFEIRNGQAEWTLRSRQASTVIAPGGGWNDEWTVKLNGRVPLDLDVELAAGEVDADLRGLQVSQVKVDVATGSTTLSLPDSPGTTTVTVKTAIGEITILAPVGVGIQLRPSRLLGSLNISGHQLSQSGSYWISDNYASAASRVDIRAEVVLGSINLR
ncbi:MAG TPA: DUF5668 domain-containing protein [Anaerolineae bacterium]|nr:DUF5668 domain-containing protein [Anaerolineae bacterium]